MPFPQYPGRIIKTGDSNKEIVKAIQKRLNEKGCGPIDPDGSFGNQTKQAVKLFQARFADADEHPLVVDGAIGPITWATLFGMETMATITTADSLLLAKVLEIAAKEIGVMEDKGRPNRGKRVDEYINSIGENPKNNIPWCAVFVYWCFEQAAQQLGRTNPVIKTAGTQDHWNKAVQKGIPTVKQSEARDNPALVKPGMVFIMSFGGRTGHTGLVVEVSGGKMVTIEGNTNDNGSREGVGVFRRTSRKINSIQKGFIDYGTQ